MAQNYINFASTAEYANREQWNTEVAAGVNMADLGYTNNDEINGISQLLYNTHLATIQSLTQTVTSPMANHFNTAMNAVFQRLALLETQNQALQAVQNSHTELLRAYKAQLDRIPADVGTGGGRQPKQPDPPTFAGSDNKQNLEEWINHVTLYCSAMGIPTDHQRILCALGRLRAPATTYMRAYYDKVSADEDLGLWTEFVRQLSSIYGKRDDKEGAKEEINALWNNKDLAKRDFIKYVEQYRTLARIVDYENKLHIDKLKNVIPQELRNVLVALDMVNKVPDGWEEYLDVLLKAYKSLHPERTKSSIFGGNAGNSGGGRKDPNAMDVDSVDKGKSREANSSEKGKKEKRFCKICDSKGLNSKKKTHNTEDCYDKPGNENKRPKPKAPNSSQNSPNRGAQDKGGKKSSKNWRVQLAEILAAAESDGESPSPPGDITVNTARIEEITEDPIPAWRRRRAPSESDESEVGPSSRPLMRKRNYSDEFPGFPKGL